MCLKTNNILIALFFLLLPSCGTKDNKPANNEIDEVSLLIKSKYLNLPVSQSADRAKMTFSADGLQFKEFAIRLAPEKPDYWVFWDISEYSGKEITINYSGNGAGLKNIYQDDRIAGEDSLYKEVNRPQMHFSSRRGWNNDPNGLVWQNGEYHLYYQHNPFEKFWENMHWGHAVSSDLVHWKEVGIALEPDSLGTMFSGSAVIDKDNLGGWGKDALVAFYTAAGKKMTQNIAWSTDNGRTFKKYEGNPILGPDRDPKVFWYEPDKTWVMVLYNDNYNIIYNSKDLKHWEQKSTVPGFYECPEFFELPVDGNSNNKKWVMYGASGTYMIGTFNGAEFKPEHGKYFYSWGSQYAAQTYNNVPDGRRIQVGWGRIEHKDMPFNQMMLFPCELTLRTTAEGIRLFCEPVKEIELLHDIKHSWSDTNGEEVNKELTALKGDLFHIKMDVEINHGLGMELFYRGNPVVYFDGNFNRFNGAPYICDKPGIFRFNIEVILDRTSVEAYIGKGRLFISEQLKEKKTEEGLVFRGDLKFNTLEITELKSIW